MRVFLVVPCYRERSRIHCYREKLRQLRAVPLECRLLFVEDGCPEECGKTLQEMGARVHFREHEGKGAAVRHGLRLALAESSSEEDVFCYTDFDCSSSLELLPRLLEPLSGAECHLSIASREGQHREK